MMKRLMTALAAACAFASANAANAFRVTPYVQHPATDAMSVLWFCDAPGKATVSCWEDGADEATAKRVEVTGAVAKALLADPKHVPVPPQAKFACRLTGLRPDTAYRYKVRLADGPTYANVFRTAPAAFRPVRFVAYSDSETQLAPKTGRWEDPTVDGDDARKTGSRRYYVSKEEGFASNVCAMAALKPDFVVVAGDLAGSGDTQGCWDQYWKHYAGALGDSAGSTPILAAPGNHDYAGYDKNSDFGEMGMGKYLTYFEYEPNTAKVDPDQRQRFHRLDYGPVALIFIDPNNGPNHDAKNTWDKWADEYARPNDRDTNQCLTEDTCRAPDFNPGSPQYRWVEEQLADAQKTKLFTFLVCHQCPYSIGYHGRANGDSGCAGGEGEYLSGVPTRCYTNLVFKYGVDAWICGHDEICEHSRLTGVEQLPDGTTRPTEIHVYDVGYGGDDLRGARRTAQPNPHEVFRAHTDAPEVYRDGTLVSGGKHYGHLEVNVTTNALGQWVCRLQQNYVFVSKDAKTGRLSFDRRTYPDVVVLTNAVGKAEPSPACGAWPLVTMRQMAVTSFDAETMRKLIAIHARHPGSCDECWLAEGYPFEDARAQARARQLGELAPLLRAAGMKAGFQQGVTLGHDFSRVPAGGLVFPDDAYQVDVDGKRTAFLCPTSPDVLAAEERFAETYVRGGRLESFWLDDDLRLGFAKGRCEGCWCDRCVRALNEKAVTNLTRSAWIERLGAPTDDEPLRAVWTDFKAESLARFAAAARRGAKRANPDVRMGYQAISSATLASGRDNRAILAALSDGFRDSVGIRPGHGFYRDVNSAEELAAKLLDVAREAERCRAIPGFRGSVAYEQENYPHYACQKSAESCVKECAAALAAGCDAIAEYWYSSAYPEPLDHYEDLVRFTQAWRPYLRELADIATVTHLGGVAHRNDPKLVTGRGNAPRGCYFLRRSKTDVTLALMGVPVTVEEAGTKSLYDPRSVPTGLYTTAARAKLMDGLDALPGGPVCVRVDKVHPLLVWPRVDGTGRTVAVTFLNVSSGLATRVPVRIRRPACGTAALLRPCADSAPLALEAGAGDEVRFTLPDLPAAALCTVVLRKAKGETRR